MKKLKMVPFISIVILHYNRVKELRISLNNLFNNLDYPRNRYEVIVVDNASKDRSIEKISLEFETIKVIYLNENIGISGWNYGIEKAKGDYILLLDDDAYIEGDNLKKAVKLIVNNQADILMMRIFTPDKKIEFTKYYPTGLLSFLGMLCFNF